jgi:hypothetical protein
MMEVIYILTNLDDRFILKIEWGFSRMGLMTPPEIMIAVPHHRTLQSKVAIFSEFCACVITKAMQ